MRNCSLFLWLIVKFWKISFLTKAHLRFIEPCLFVLIDCMWYLCCSHHKISSSSSPGLLRYKHRWIKMKVPSTGMCSSSVPFTFNHSKPWKTSSCPYNVSTHSDSAGGEWGNVLEQLKLSKVICPTPILKAVALLAVKRATDFLLNCLV